MKLCGIIYKVLLYFVPEITGVKCGKKQRKQGIINFLSVNGKCLQYRWLVRKAAKKSDDRYSVVTLIILSSLSVYPMNRGMQGFGDE